MRQRSGVHLSGNVLTGRGGPVEHFGRPVQLAQRCGKCLDIGHGRALAGLADGMADCPSTHLDLLAAIGGLLGQGLGGRCRCIGCRAYPRGHRPGQLPIARHALQGLIDLALGFRGVGLVACGELGAPVMLQANIQELFCGSQELLVERHEFRCRPVAFAFELVAELFEQLRQRTDDPSLLVERERFVPLEDGGPSGAGCVDGHARQSRTCFVGSHHRVKSMEAIPDLALLFSPLVGACGRELLRANGLAEFLLSGQELGNALLGLDQHTAGVDLQRSDNLLQTRNDGPLGLRRFDEIGSRQLLGREGHCVDDACLSQCSAGLGGQCAKVARLVGSGLQDLVQTDREKPECLLRLAGSGHGAFVLIVQAERIGQDGLLPAEKGSRPLGKLGQLPPQSKALTFGQNLKQNPVHRLLCILVQHGPLGRILGGIGSRELLDGFGHFVVDQVSGSLAYLLQVVVERELAHVVLFQLLHMRPENIIEQFLHELLGPLLVVALPGKDPGILLGGLAESATDRPWQCH